MWLPWQQEKVYSSSFAFKTSPLYFRKNHKVSRKSFCRFGIMLQKPQGGGGGGEILSPNRVNDSSNLEKLFRIFGFP